MPQSTPSSVIDRMKSWPVERRNEAERLLEAMEHAGVDVYRLSEAERTLVEEGIAEADRGEFVSDAEMEAFWNRHDK